MGAQDGLNTAPASGVRLSDKLFLAYRRSRLRGFHLAWRLWQAAGGAPGVRLRTRHGAVFETKPVGYIENFLVDHGFYEGEVFEALGPFLGADSVFWDIGANFGLHSVTAKVVSPAAVVVAFEPVPELLRSLRRNAELNGVEITLRGEALCAESGRATLSMPAGGTSGRASLHALHDVPQVDRMLVDCARGRDLVAGGHLPPPSVIKVDVEGAEAEVLDGLGDLLLDTRLRAVVFEGAPGLAEDEALDPVGARLTRAGFRLHQLRRMEPTHHPLENYLAVRPGSRGDA